MTAITVTHDTINAALPDVKAGDTLILLGEFGARRSWAKVPVIVDARGAVIRDWYLSAVPGWDWSGGRFVGEEPLRLSSRNGVKSRDCTFTGAEWIGPEDPGAGSQAAGTGLKVTDAANIALRRCRSTGFKTGASFSRTLRITVEDSIFERMGANGVALGSCWTFSINRNALYGFRPLRGEHPDAIQAWSDAAHPPTADGEIGWNHIQGDTMGIGFHDHGTDGGFDRIQIHDNFVSINRSNAITLINSRSSRVANNTVRTEPCPRDWARIRAPGAEMVNNDVQEREA